MSELTLAEKARADGLDERTIELAYADFTPGHMEQNEAVLDAHRRVCIRALCYDNPVGNVRFPMHGAGIVREQPLTPGEKQEPSR